VSNCYMIVIGRTPLLTIVFGKRFGSRDNRRFKGLLCSWGIKLEGGLWLFLDVVEFWSWEFDPESRAAHEHERDLYPSR
jgi:hypothetical protein